MCTNELIVLHPLGIFIFGFLVFSEKNPVLPGSNSRPNVSEGYEVPTELPGSTGFMYLKYDKNAHSMYGCECHAAIAKPAAAVTRVQSPSQEVGSGDNGLGLLCFDLSSAETDFWWPEDEQCRGFASSLHEKCKTPLNKNTHGMYGAACDAAIAKLPPL